MNDTENETVRFSKKPNPFSYALEVTWHALIMGTVISGIPFIIFAGWGWALVALVSFVLVGLFFFIAAFLILPAISCLSSQTRGQSSDLREIQRIGFRLRSKPRVKPGHDGVAYPFNLAIATPSRAN
jgi:hypothetical protein